MSPASAPVDPISDGGDGDGDGDGDGELPRPGRRRVVRAVAPIAVALGVLFAVGRALTPLTVRVTTVVRGSAVDAVYASGTVEAIDRVDVKARIAGFVAALPVKEGDRVTRGQLLARLEAPALQIDIDRGHAEVEAARERSRPSLAALRARERMTAAELADARVERDQDERIARAGGVPVRDLERARLRVTTLEQQLEMGRAQLQETEVLRQVDVARSTSDYADAQARSRDAEVRSPLAGDVLRSLVDLGRVVQPNEVLLRIGDARRLHIEALVDEDDVTRVQRDRACVIRVAALGERVLHGHVSRVAPEADREHHSFRIVVALDDGADGLRPGMSAEVDVIAARREGALMIGREAVRDGYVWRLEADGRLHRRAVKLGVGDLDRVEVLDGVGDGDRVAAHPDPDLADDLRARAEPEPAPAPAALARAGTR